METYLVYVDTANNSNKFWSAKVEQNNLTVQWGRVGYQAQTKVHSCTSHQKAIIKFHNLVAQKKLKGYKESQSQIDNNRNISEIRRAIQLLGILRPYIENGNFDSRYIQTVNEYLRIVPTPLGMQIDPYRVYRTIADIDHQRSQLYSLLPTDSNTLASTEVKNTKVVSLRSITKSFWRHL